MQPYLFRQEERPKFNVMHAGLLALIVLALLLGAVERHDPFRLSPEELARLKEEDAERRRDMVFRFSDAPDEDIEQEDARFQSDADRQHRSMQEQSPNEDPDPYSKGNTYELQNSRPPSPSEQAQNNPAQNPSPQVRPQQAQQQRQQAQNQPRRQAEQAQQPEARKPADKPEAKRQEQAAKDEQAVADVEEPQKPEEREVEADKQFDKSAGKLPILPGAPKPYRPMSAKEMSAAREAAAREMKVADNQSAVSGAGQTATFDNPNGSGSPLMGLTVETTRSDLGPYLKILKQLISGNWRVPNIARYEARGVTGISFNIHKDGSFSDVRVILKSGYEPLDVSSLNAINTTTPAPPLPKFVDEDVVPIRFGFYYNMRPTY